MRVGDTERKSRDSTSGHALGCGHGFRGQFFIGGCVNKRTGCSPLRQVTPAETGVEESIIGYEAHSADVGFIADILYFMRSKARAKNHVVLRRELLARGTDIHAVCIPTDKVGIFGGDIGRQFNGLSCLDKQIFFFYIILVQNGDLTEGISVYFLGRNLQFRFRRCAVFLGKYRGRQHREHHQDCQEESDGTFDFHFLFLQWIGFAIGIIRIGGERL